MSPGSAPLFAVVIHEKGGGERREVFESAEITVGRVQGNDLMLPKGNVSKRHARLLYRDGRFIVTDLNSTNGTYVNRRRIAQATIVRESDRIYIGDFVLGIEPKPGLHPVSEPDGVSSTSRGSLPTGNDLQPGQSVLPAIEDEDEQTRSAARHTGLVPTSSSESLRVSPDPVSSARPAMRSQVEPDGPASVLLTAVAQLVEAGARDLPPEKLMGAVTPAVAEQIEARLQAAWPGLEDLGVPKDQAVALARAELLETGPLAELLEDPAVSEIVAVGSGPVSVSRQGRPSLSSSGFSSETSLRWAAARLCLKAGAALGADRRVTRQLPDGTRLTAVLGRDQGIVLSLKRPRRLGGTLDELVRRGTVSRAMATFLYQCLSARLNLLIVGPRDGGVELVLGALLSAVPEREQVFVGEIGGGSRPGRRLGADPSPDTAEAIGLAAQAAPLRMIVDLDGPERIEAVCGAAASGADGILAALPAGSTQRGLHRVRAALAATRGLPAAGELLAAAFEVVVEVARLRDDRHRVLRVAELGKPSGEDPELLDIFTFVVDRTAAGGLIEGSFVPTGATPNIVELLRSRGTSVDSSLFSRPPSR